MERVGILVAGPNASGKTSAVKAACAAYAGDGRLRAVFADHELASRKVEDVERIISAIWADAYDVVIFEGTRIPTALQRVHEAVGGRRLGAFVTTVAPVAMERQMRARCDRVGKRYRADYWSVKKLEYEGRRRYRMSVPRFVPDAAIRWYEVDESYAGAQNLSADLRQELEAVLGAPHMSEFGLSVQEW